MSKRCFNVAQACRRELLGFIGANEWLGVSSGANTFRPLDFTMVPNNIGFRAL